MNERSKDNFLNLHVLVTTSFANPNRDDTGAPKQVTYGGVPRLRLSSQALTRAKRLDYESRSGGDQRTRRAKGGMVELGVAMAKDSALQGGTPLTEVEIASVTKQLIRDIQSLVANQERADKAAAEKLKKKATKATESASEDQDKAETGDAPTAPNEPEGGPKDTLVWLAEDELAGYVAKALAQVGRGVADGDFIQPGGRTQSLTIAAFGRMFAQRPDLQNEAAVQRSHAFTTHAADVEPDYFIAANDLPLPQDGRGAGHLGLSQFGTGTYYWHCNIDRGQLWKTWIAADDDLTRERLIAFFEALLRALPNGKANTTAYKTVPDAVLATQASAPVALHQAFERAVPVHDEGGYRAGSLEALLKTNSEVVAFTPGMFAGEGVVASLGDCNTRGARKADSLPDLVRTCVEWALAGHPERATAL